jgi:outer membrane protein OmpA-like peptidoglycan-associated protein
MDNAPVSAAQDTFFIFEIFDNVTRKPVRMASVTCNNFLWLTDERGHAELPLNEMCNGILVIAREGYQEVLFDATKRDLTKNSKTIYLQPLVKEAPVTLSSIFYDFDKWNIKPEARSVLDKLVALLNNNNQMKIELSSHADSRGAHSYNMILTERRSNSAIDYIVRRGIEGQRLVAYNYGETRLANHCADGVKCTEAEHAMNRRTDFKLISGSAVMPELTISHQTNAAQNDTSIFYTVQILALNRVPANLPAKYKQDGKVVQKQVNGFAKFFVGQYDSYASAATSKNSLKNMFRDAFVVAIRNGEVVQICDLNKKAVHNDALVLK